MGTGGHLTSVLEKRKCWRNENELVYDFLLELRKCMIYTYKFISSQFSIYFCVKDYLPYIETYHSFKTSQNSDIQM